MRSERRKSGETQEKRRGAHIGTRRTAWAVAAVVAAAGLAVEGSAHASASAFFQRLKARENAAGPAPPATGQVVVGALDCDTGAFTMGASPTTTRDVAGGGYNTVQHVTTYRLGAFAKRVQMRFTATNRRGRALAASLSFGSSASNGQGALVNPKAAGAGADADVVAFDIGEASGRFTFAVKCGDQVATGPRLVNGGQPSTGYDDPEHCPPTNRFCACPKARPGCQRTQDVHLFEHAHAWTESGGIEIEAVPVAVIYDLPQARDRKNVADYLDKGTIGARAALHFVSANGAGKNGKRRPRWWMRARSHTPPAPRARRSQAPVIHTAPHKGR